MSRSLNRRRFLAYSSCAMAGAAASRSATAEPLPPADVSAQVADHTLTVIEGSPRERGRLYGEKFHAGIHGFLQREIFQVFATDDHERQNLLRYGGACADQVAEFSPEIMEELSGVSEATGIDIRELVLITLHEELYHRGQIPIVPHCTAVAFGPPESVDGDTYCGQTWDWMPRLLGMSQLVHWKRENGPDVLGYAYPGLWTGAGMNSNGLALTWTSGEGKGISGPRVGIPSYLLIAHLLYQPSLEAALEEARRATHAGWFTFVLADGEGRLANVEGSPRELAIEHHRGHLARAYYGSRQMTQTPEGEVVRYGDRCAKMYELLSAQNGQITPDRLKADFCRKGVGIYNDRMTIDVFLFNTTRRTLEITRGLEHTGRWQSFALKT
jgi:hypothetical protein